MKKVLLLCLIVIIAAAMCACDSEPSRFADYDDEEIYDLGYEEGRRAGMEYVVETLMDEVYSHEEYVYAEDIHDILYDYLEDDSAEYVEEIILYNSDCRRFDMEAALEELIRDSLHEY